MIRRETINGRKATVAYMLGNWTPCDPDHAKLIKVIFDDGEVLFLRTPQEPDVTIDESKLSLGQLEMIKLMREAHIPITRENYINAAYLGDVPDEWTPEHEAELPEELREQ